MCDQREDVYPMLAVPRFTLAAACSAKTCWLWLPTSRMPTSLCWSLPSMTTTQASPCCRRRAPRTSRWAEVQGMGPRPGR